MFSLKERSGWWWLLSVCHAINCVLVFNRMLHTFGLFHRSQKASLRHSRQHNRNVTFLARRFACMTSEIVKEVAPPVLIAMVLYGAVSETIARYCMACAVILLWYADPKNTNLHLKGKFHCTDDILFYLTQRTLTYILRGSFTVRVTSCFICFHSDALHRLN